MIPLFIYLNALDFLTTLVGLKHGYSEASPFIAMFIHVNPILGLVIAKLCAAVIAAVGYYFKKPMVIVVLNYWLAGLIVWNLVEFLR